MSSRFRTSLIAAMVLLSACNREERDSRGKPIAETVPAGATADTIYPGGPSGVTMTLNPQAASFERNAYHLAQGQELYSKMNCVGCHAHGGGGMGPALIDDQWRYGGRLEQIATTIMEGRPNGMPSFRGKLTETQVWELAAYVRAMSGQVPKDALSARADEVSNTPPLTQTRREPIRPSEVAVP